MLLKIYETSHESEALGLSKALSSHSTITAMYLLDNILPQVVKLSRALQTKQLDLSLISSLVDATFNSLDDAKLPSANWVIQLQDDLDKCSFEERVGNISSRFRASSKDVLSAFSIFDPKKVPSLSTHELPLCGDSSIQTLIVSFGRDLPAKSLEGTEFERAAIVYSDPSTERKLYRQLLQPKDVSMQLKELLTNDMLIALFPIYINWQPYACLFPFLQHSRTKLLRHEINKESPS